MTPPTDRPSASRPAVPLRQAAGWLLADLALVVAFAATGRSTHESGLAILGILSTAGPFLAACLLTWAALRVWRSPATPWPTGVLVWLGTAVGGLALRGLFGGGMAVSFLVVAIAVLGVLLMLPRTVATLLLRRRRTSG